MGFRRCGLRRWLFVHGEEGRAQRQDRLRHRWQGDGDRPRPDSRPAGRTVAELEHHQRLAHRDHLRRHEAAAAAQRGTRLSEELYGVVA